MSKLDQGSNATSDRSKGAPEPAIPADPQPRGDQERPMTDEEQLDEGLDETFPASDPIAPSRIDGPNN
ncbi:hypothetical protein [Aureimonas leprariae]|uniref:Uncharacterized protein n=1 Tax=Plantimonas leprariae TaxID=2615207 RepID=A0A7V7PSU2_9HYPH|nr:hypothetical protein [Aureimonas leprariae]KAB0682612.1 hypothetical protein F6X38_00520 [Aureimonas leprariae]